MFTGKQSLKEIARISSYKAKKFNLKQLFYVLVLCPCFFFFCKFAAQPSKPRVLTVAIEKPEIRNYDDDDDDVDVDDGKDDEDDTQHDDDNDDGLVHEDIDDDDDSDQKVNAPVPFLGTEESGRL